MSPTSTARHPSTQRKIVLCAAALMVTLLPTACGAAYADTGYTGHTGHGTVEVGGVAAAEPIDDKDGAAAGDAAGDNDADGDAAAEEGADQGQEAGGQEPPVDDGAQQGDQNNDQNNNNQDQNQNNQNQNNQDQNNDGGEKGGQFNEAPGNAQGGQEPPPPANEGGNEANNGLDVLGTDCTNSQLEPHNGFEVAPACVDTSFGEVASEDKSPSLLITEAPQTVAVGQDFTLSVSTRNLIRDRFLGAAAGGYYLESSFLNEEGLQRGHFHTACRILDNTNEAPDAAPAPEFFVATQDNGGGAAPDTVQIEVPGIDTAGTLQCTSWAGDGSHRTPMMQRANQTPAIDSVRITVE
jgi:hypothetical protein